MHGHAVEVLEDENHIEILETELHAFKVRDFNFVQGDDEEGGLGELYKAICGRLKEDIGAVWYAIKAELAEGNVGAGGEFVFCSVLDPLSESFEMLVEGGALPALFLLLFKFFFIAETVFSAAVSRLIECHVGGFFVELDVFGFLLADKDRVFEVQVDYYDEFMGAGLEEEVFHVAEEDVDFAAAVVHVTETVLVDLYFTCDALAF